MNTCFKCNNQILGDAKFCPHCGANIININNNQGINNMPFQNVTPTTNNPQIMNNVPNYNLPPVQTKPVIKKGIKCKKCNTINAKKTAICYNCGNNLKKQKRRKRLIKLAIFVGIILLIMGISSLNKKYKATEFDILMSGIEENKSNSFYYLDKKLESLEFKINTFKSIKSIEIKVYANKLELDNFNLKGKRKVQINNITLINGLNTIEVTYKLKKKTINKKFNIYNTNDENIKNLDINDDDNDKVLNYMEDVYNSNKNMKDTDSDGLDDYLEINKTYTDPCNKYTYENTIDTDYDFDGDSIPNIVEINNNTNPIMVDTDLDGLSDSEELKLGTDPLLADTDKDGVDDYIESKYYNTSATAYNKLFSGNVSKDGIASVYLENLTIDDISDVSIEQVDHYMINEDFDGYIMSPYLFKANKELDSLNISFDFSSYGNVVEPTIYKIDINTNKLIEVNTTIENKVAKANITDYESPYVLFDKNKLADLINGFIKENELNIDIDMPEGNQYLMLDFPIIKFIVNLIKGTSEKAIIYCYGECSENSMKRDQDTINNTLSEVKEGTELFEIQKVNYFGMKFIKFLQKWLESFMLNFIPDSEFYRPTLKDERSYAAIYSAVYILDVYNAEDLETILYGNYTGKLLGSDYKSIDIMKQKDTNKDGLSDSITELIIAGEITTETGVNPFEGYTLKQVNKNDDFDKDGLKNNEEIVLKYDKGYYYLEMKSSPVMADSDEDGLHDDNDPYPLYPFNANFKIRNSLKGEPSNLGKLQKQVDDFNSLFDKGNLTLKGIEYTDKNGNLKISKNSYFVEYYMMRAAAEAGKILFLVDAARAEDRYFKATAMPYTEADASKYLIEAPEIIYFIEETIDEYKQLGYDAVAKGKTYVFENRNFRTGANGGGVGQLNWSNVDRALNSTMFLHYASANSIGEITNKNGVYTLKLRYFIEDVYDWATEVVEGNDSTKVEVMYFNKLLLGEAKGFLVHIEYDITVTFGKNIEDTYKIEAKPIYR